MSKPFAKLFDTPQGQLLVTTETGTSEAYGPCLRTRGADAGGIIVEITHGPWPDTPGGWDHVQALLDAFDQAQAEECAASFVRMIANLSSEDAHD
jgi:hypothetical protein